MAEGEAAHVAGHRAPSACTGGVGAQRALTRRQGRPESSPCSVVRLLWLTDRCSCVEAREAMRRARDTAGLAHHQLRRSPLESQPTCSGEPGSGPRHLSQLQLGSDPAISIGAGAGSSWPALLPALWCCPRHQLGELCQCQGPNLAGWPPSQLTLESKGAVVHTRVCTCQDTDQAAPTASHLPSHSPSARPMPWLSNARVSSSCPYSKLPAPPALRGATLWERARHPGTVLTSFWSAESSSGR